MSLSRKLTALAAGAAALALALSGCGGGSDDSASGDLQQVKFGYIADYNGTSLLAIAKDQKLWEKHGLKADTKVFTNGPLQIQALGTGDLDFGYIGPGAFWLPASGQAKIVAINTLGNADRVIARSGTTSIDQLRGKTVGVPEGTSGDMILTLALQKAGMTKKDVKVVNMDASTIVSAFASKKIDAAGFWYPAIGTIKKQVPDLTELAKNSDFESQVSFPTAFVAGNDVVSGQKDKTEKTIAVLRDAMAYRSANMDKSIQLTAKMLSVPVDQVKADAGNVKVLSVDELDAKTKDGTIGKWLNGMADYFVQAGKLKSKADPETYYTGDLFTAAGSGSVAK
ncbi:NitT/TauT family transport system substrate-binding protein [Kribbella sp. VKM Ac-2571]|uniref:aliphatic sulfonate ABC transporter substrate-binding protein n=1 Tax=Kribbella sp. VKM Ac-2571 TaxID=2512222 RepID=UPI00105BB321|nr:aliphatic sulfonate ABC transporter substrate-binding protein [Kribbella sp. VKM Ac-2571]TDO69211.1 NitT/TauT family transport system substrate-binding protein [Kribbella sp. VKM Ac-2571]